MFDLLTISIGVGLVISLLFSESLGRNVGGLIVPGYLAFHVGQPLNILLTIVVAIATYAIVYWASNHLIIYGKRRTVAMILVGFILGGLTRLLLASVVPMGDADALVVIGFIIPGLIAIWFDRQGVLDTCSAMLTATAATRLVLVVVAASYLQQWELHNLPQPEETPNQQTATQVAEAN